MQKRTAKTPRKVKAVRPKRATTLPPQSKADGERKLIIAVDVDGTLHLEDFPYLITPNEPLISWIKEHRTEYTFILNTCRTGRQLQMALDWLKEQGLEFDYVNENCDWAIKAFRGDTRKIYADYYIDDKSVVAEDFLRVMGDMADDTDSEDGFDGEVHFTEG